jgi:hypothetical protein
MNGVQVIQAALGSTQFLVNKYLEDLSDADLVVRPVAGANHLAWQLGHLISSEVSLVTSQLPQATYPELPAGWTDAHSMERTGKDGSDGFLTKGEYGKLFNDVRNATIATVGQLNDADLDRPTQGVMAPFAPKLGNLLILVANHTLMHAGQFSVLRRKLGKPVLF